MLNIFQNPPLDFILRTLMCVYFETYLLNCRSSIENIFYSIFFAGNVQPFQYPSQEVAIATHRPKSSPSTDSIPEMKTFQQSPIREESLFLQAVHNSAQSIAPSHNHNGALNTVIYFIMQTSF